jgi:hypothetical protein
MTTDEKHSTAAGRAARAAIASHAVDSADPVVRPAKRPHNEGGASAGGGGGGGGDGVQYRDVIDIDSDEDSDDGGVLEWFDLPADSSDVVEGVADTKTDAEPMGLVRQLDSAAVGATAARPSASASASAGGGGAAVAHAAAAAPPSAAAFYAGSNAAREKQQRAERSRVAARKAKDKAADEKLTDSENTIWRADGDLVDYEPPNCVCTEALPTDADYSDDGQSSCALPARVAHYRVGP